MRKNPAMVAERKIRMTRSGHISSPRKQSMNESLDLAEGIGFKKKAAALALLLVAGLWGLRREEDQWRIRGSWVGAWVWVGAADWIPLAGMDGFLPRLGRRGRARAHQTPPLATCFN